MVRAAIYHDYGWITYETSPLVSEESGEPYRFLELPLEATPARVLPVVHRLMAATDAYAALIISPTAPGSGRVATGSCAIPSAGTTCTSSTAGSSS